MRNPNEIKVCSRCETPKKLSEFYFRKTRNVYYTCCKECFNKKTKKYYQDGYAKSLNHMMNSRVSNIRRKGVIFSKNLKNHLIELWDKQNNKCYYTGIEMVLHGYKENVRNSMTIDRIEPSKGYVEGNIVLCCSIVNKIKQDLSLEELLNWCDEIKNHVVAKGLEPSTSCV